MSQSWVRSGLRSSEEKSEQEAAEDGGRVCSNGLNSAPVQDGLALLPHPEGVVLAHDGVVEPELGVVGQVVWGLPLGDDRVLQRRILVGEAAAANGVAVDRLHLGHVRGVVRQELSDGFLQMDQCYRTFWP